MSSRLADAAFVLVVCLLVAGLGATPLRAEAASWDSPAQAGPATPLMLLMDNSGSMASTDPGGLRFEAAAFLVDFLDADRVASGREHEVGFILFAGDAEPARWLDFTPLRAAYHLVKQEIESIRREVSPEGWTDFALAFEAAGATILRHAEVQAAQPRYVVIVFTDGVAEPGKLRRDMTVAEIAAHYRRVGETIGQLEANLGEPLEVFAVTVGRGIGDAPYWSSTLGEGPGRRRVYHVASPADYFKVFREIGTQLLGMTGGDIIALRDTERTTFEVPPYLERLTITVFKQGDIGVEVGPAGLEGAAVSGIFRPGPYDRHVSTRTYELFSVSFPEHGNWEVRATGEGGVWLWVDHAPARPWVRQPQSLHPARRPLELWVEMVYPSTLEPVRVLAAYPLDLRVHVSAPGLQLPGRRLLPQELDGTGAALASFRTVLLPAPVVTGTWTIDVEPVIGPVGPARIPGLQKTVAVRDFPLVADLRLHPEPVALGETVRIRARLEGTPGHLHGFSLDYSLTTPDGTVLAQGTLSPLPSTAGQAGWFESTSVLPAGVPPGPRETASWPVTLERLFFPGRGQVILAVVLSGWWSPPDGTPAVLYHDRREVVTPVMSSRVEVLAALIVLCLVQWLALRPGKLAIGEIRWETGGRRRTRRNVRRHRLPGAVAVCAGTGGARAWTRYHARGVRIRAVLTAGGNVWELGPGDAPWVSPDGRLKVWNTSVSGEHLPPGGLVADFLYGLVVAAGLAVVFLTGWRLLFIPGVSSRVLAGLYGLAGLAVTGLLVSGLIRRLRGASGDEA